jgi:hypothetical protein
MIDLIYKAIADKLAALQNEEGEYILKHIDLWNQNVEFLEQEQPWNTPACFIEIPPFTWNQLGNKAQQADIVVRLHIVTRWAAPTIHDGEYTATGLHYLAIPDYIFDTLHGCQIDGMQTLQRTNSEPNHNHGEVIDSVEVYLTSVIIQPTDKLISEDVDFTVSEA